MKQSTKLDAIPWIEPVDCYEIPDDCLAEFQVINPDIPNDMIKYQLRKAMQEFAERSRIQIRNVTIQVQPCVCDYPINLPHGEEFLSFQRQSQRTNRPAETTTECGSYQFHWDVPSCTVTVAPAPTCIEPVKLMIATAGIAAAATDKIVGHATGPFTMQHRRIL